MKMVRISDVRPEPGELLEWHATADALAAAATAPVPSGVPTFLQGNQLRGELATSERGAPHRAYLGAATEMDGALDPAAMTRALQRFVRRHDGMRTWFDMTGAEPQRLAIECAAVDFEVLSAGESTSYARFERYLDGLFSAEAIASSWPGFAFGAVSRSDGFTMYWGCDHALTDGASQAMVLAQIAELYAEETGASAHTPDDGEGSFVQYAAAEQQLASSFGPDAEPVREWVDIFTRNGGMPRFPLDLGLATGERAPVHPVDRDLLLGADLDRFESVCKAAGGRVVGGVVAAIAITDLELAGRSSYYAMNVLGTRALGNWATSQGWFCNFAPIAFDIDGATSFSELVERAQGACVRARELAVVPIQSVLGALLAAGTDPQELAATPNMLSYMDFRWFPGLGTAPYDRGVQFTGEGETANASMWINREVGRLQLGAQTPRHPFAQLQLNRYFDHLIAVVTAVARDGDYAVTRVPSKDFALAHQHN